VERHLSALLEGWCGPAADAYRARWDQVHRGLSELDHRLHTNADHLRILAGLVEDAQSGYDHTLAAAGITTVVGIGLTLVSGGASDALAVEADGALGATVTAMIGEFEAAISRMAALVTELADTMGALASRFAFEFAIKGPDLAYGAAGGAATGIAFALADGERNLRDLALSGVVGGLVEGGRLGRRGRGGGEEGSEQDDPAPRGPRGPMSRDDPVEQRWRASLSPAQAAKQAEFDARALWLAKPGNHAAIEEPLTGSVATTIDAQYPGMVQFVNQRIIDADPSRVQELTDLDVVTEHVVIQVKSGRTRGLSRQMERSRSVTGKAVVGYAPAMDDSDFRRYKRNGYTVFRTLPDLLEFLRGQPS
jgi:hypothetical protein